MLQRRLDRTPSWMQSWTGVIIPGTDSATADARGNGKVLSADCGLHQHPLRILGPHHGFSASPAFLAELARLLSSGQAPLMKLPLASAAVAATLALGCSQLSSPPTRVPFEGAFDVAAPGVMQATGLSSADFDQDGRADLAVLSGATARVKILLNAKAGFREAAELDAGASASGMALGDFDTDG